LAEQLRAQALQAADSVVTAYASPRRLAAHITHVWLKAADKAVQQKLMPVTVGLNADGLATPALIKKLQALGADVSDPAATVAALRRAPDGKADALFYDSLVSGATLDTGLQKALEEAIAKLPIPKVMSYQLETDCELPGWSSVHFVRPAHGLVALHGNTVVPVKVLGLKAGNSTQGHRFEAKVSPVVLAHADDYAVTLAEDGAVIASFAERRAEIARQLAAAAAKVGGGARPIEDEALLDEVTGLVERPNVLVCEFEAQFLDVPQECLILTMKANQKYFPLLDAQGKLSNKFLVVSNISPADASAVIGGNERVVRPRLADAKFFFDQDSKKSLESRVAGLDKVVYHNKLGSQGERMARVSAIAKVIGLQLSGDVKRESTPESWTIEKDGALAQAADTAARLAKTDLLTDMVGEFPELQGIMGGYYARHDGLGEDIALAVEDHYKPRFAGDELPRNQVGVVVALADKLETLVGMFGIGNVPTGDKDPFALRRHALGVIRMLIEKNLPLELCWLLHNVGDPFGGLIDSDRAKLVNELQQFIFDRLAGSLR
ncbi:MAG: glycine--tRNA ligase subunit beta, partial [Rhodoferax sp.]